MGQLPPERDWKCMKKIRDELLSSLCKRMNARAEEILSDLEASEHKKYIDLLEHMQESDRIVAECFDDWRRSNLLMKIYALLNNDILDEKQILLLSDETRQRLEVMRVL